MSVITGRHVTRDQTVDCDVCVVGSGAGGAHVAARLAETGKSVIVVEEGGFHMSRSFDMTERNMTPRLYQERGWRATADGAIGILQGRAVGGTTVVNWTTCIRTPARVLEHWAEHHGIEGLSVGALEPHFQRVEERLNVQLSTLDEINENNRVLWRGAQKLGWKTHLLSRNVKNCAHSGYCGMGCPIDAKQSMLVTLIPDAIRNGARVYANARAERVETAGRRATEVVATILDPETDTPNGATLRVRAKTIVVAGGGINSPALLLRSGLDGNGCVGKRTFLHPATAVAGVHDHPIEGFNGAPQYVGCTEFSERPPSVMSLLIESAPVFPVMTAASNLEFGAAHQAVMDHLSHLSVTNAILADGFDVTDSDEGGTITLRDSGQPKVTYKWTPRLSEGLREVTKRTAQIQLAAGAREVHTLHGPPMVVRREADLSGLDEARYGPNEVSVFSAHVMGGCAMGADPGRSVVSPTFCYHGLDNLFVIDGSVFPTSLGVNPQLTIYAIASLASRYVEESVA